MKIGLIGGSSQQRMLPFNAEDTINLYPVADTQGKENAALYGTPGLALFATTGNGEVRGEFCATNGRAFVVSDSRLFEINSDGSSIMRGNLNTSSGIVSFAENGLQLMVCDGEDGYIFTYATNVTAQITDPDFPSSGTVCFIDGYFIVNKLTTGAYYISALYDGFTWGALDFASAESSPDILVRVINIQGQLYGMGTFTTEIFTNTGDSTFPFKRISGANMEQGIIAAHSAVAVDNSVVWVGGDNNGSGIVYKAQGFTPVRISTNAIELIIQRASNQEDMRGYTYQQGGHTFYVLTGGGLEVTLVYDLSTQIWHKRAYTNEYGEYEQHLGSSMMFAFNRHLVGSRVDGKVYEMSEDLYSDDGEPLVSTRIYTHLSDEGKRIRYNSLEIGVEVGVGLEDTSVPLISMRLSKDGAKTWSDWKTASIGAIGKYMTKVIYRRLGIAEQMTFEIRISDPIPRRLCGSYLNS